MIGKALVAQVTAALAIAAALAALVAQPALAFDGRSVDTRAAAETQGYSFDARSPDTRGAVKQSSGSWLASEEIDAVSRMEPQVASIQLATVPADGFSWGDIGIGVGAALGAVLLLGLFAAARRATRTAAI